MKNTAAAEAQIKDQPIVERAPKKPAKEKKAKKAKPGSEPTARERALDILDNFEEFERSGAQRTRAMTYAHLSNADAADRQTAAIEKQNVLLEVIARQMQASHRLAIYGTPDHAFPEGVKDQMKANAGIKFARPEDSAREDTEN